MFSLPLSRSPLPSQHVWFHNFRILLFHPRAEDCKQIWPKRGSQEARWTWNHAILLDNLRYGMIWVSYCVHYLHYHLFKWFMIFCYGYGVQTALTGAFLQLAGDGRDWDGNGLRGLLPNAKCPLSGCQWLFYVILSSRMIVHVLCESVWASCTGRRW